uniref:PAT1 domain containing protein n=1 Tax=Panagrellus redivivus TaxID=6233 RepID=A0A7E4V450_PANRE
MASNDYDDFYSSGIDNDWNENRHQNQSPSDDEAEERFAKLLDEMGPVMAWEDGRAPSHARSYKAESVASVDLEPLNRFSQHRLESWSLEPSLWDQQLDADILDFLQTPYASPQLQNADEPQPSSSSETQPTMLEASEPLQPQSSESPSEALMPVEPQVLHDSETSASMQPQHEAQPQQPSPYYQPEPQFLMPSECPPQTSAFLPTESQNAQSEYLMAPPPSQSAQPIHFQQSQYLMPHLPNPDTLLMPPPSNPLSLRSQLRVIVPVQKKRQTAKTTTIPPRAKPYTTKAPAKRGNTNANISPKPAMQPIKPIYRAQATAPLPPARSAPPQPTVQTLQSDHHIEATAWPQSPMPHPQIQQQPLTDANALNPQPLAGNKFRAVKIKTFGLNFPNALQHNNTIEVMTNVPKGLTYPKIQLMNTGRTTIPVLVHDGNTAEIPTFMEDEHGVIMP